jgi:hypothetical protein
MKDVLTIVGYGIAMFMAFLVLMEMARIFNEKVRAGRILPFMPPPPPGDGPIIDVDAVVLS